ncbi:MAG: DMT family transporter [Muribaculum sp.]|nr:DMT family transporter [Muribaculum sp.]
MWSPRNMDKLLLHGAALLTVSAWGVSFVSSRILMDNDFSPTEVFICRTFLAYLLLVMLCHKCLMANSWGDEALFLASGLCGSSLYFIAENTAMQYTLVSNVSLIVTLSPIITAVLVAIFYHNEKLSRGMFVGSAIAFVGVGLVVFNSNFSLSIKPLGDMLAFAAAVSWAVYSLVIRKLSAIYTPLFITRKTFFYGLLTALPFLLFEQDTQLEWSVFMRPVVIGNLLFLGVFCSLIAFYLWSWIVKGMGAVMANNYIYVSPIITLIASWLVLGETITIVGISGCALILIGVWLSERLKVKRPDRRPV